MNHLGEVFGFIVFEAVFVGNLHMKSIAWHNAALIADEACLVSIMKIGLEIKI